MAATILVKDALARVSGLLNDLSPQYARWPEAELVRWLNDAQLAVAKYLPSASSRVDAVKLQPGTRQSIAVIQPGDCKPGDGSTPVAPVYGILLLGVRRNMGEDGATPGKAIRMMDSDALDGFDPSWHITTSSFVRAASYRPVTPKYFWVHPGVSDTQWVEIEYLAVPLRIADGGLPGTELYAAVGTNTATITIDDENLDELVNYVCARAHMKEVKWADRAIAQAYTAAFVASINARVAALTGTNPNLQRLPFSTEMMGQAQ